MWRSEPESVHGQRPAVILRPKGEEKESDPSQGYRTIEILNLYGFMENRSAKPDGF